MLKYVWLDSGNNSEADLRDAYSVRKTVFIAEQDFSKCTDDTDKTAIILVIYDDGVPVATGRIIRLSENLWKIGRIAALKTMRGRGIGSLLVSALENRAASLGASEMTVGAQKQASGFYEKLGYSVCGEEYREENRPHLPMMKKL